MAGRRTGEVDAKTSARSESEEKRESGIRAFFVLRPQDQGIRLRHCACKTVWKRVNNLDPLIRKLSCFTDEVGFHFFFSFLIFKFYL